MKYVNSIELGSDKARSFLKDAETTKCQLPKLKVAGSNPVSRSKDYSMLAPVFAGTFAGDRS